MKANQQRSWMVEVLKNLGVQRPDPVTPVRALYDDRRAEQLRVAVRSADIPDDLRTFLLAAAGRHTVFDYGRIARYYEAAAPEVQQLFEDSALVLVDIDHAIRGGYVKLREELREVRLKSTGADEAPGD